jgi:general secretion pathway protein M
MIDRHDALTERLEQLRGLPQFNDFLLNQSAPNLAAAELENRVKTTVAQRQGRMISMQMVPTTATPEGLLPVTIKISARGTIETVQALLHALESGTPLLFLDNVEVAPSRGTRSRYQRTIAAPQLDISFDLTGYIRAEEGQGA